MKTIKRTDQKRVPSESANPRTSSHISLNMGSIRISIFGKKWLRKFSNIFDTFLVWGMGVIVIWIIEPFSEDVRNFRMLQVLRAFRLMRIARVVRMLPMFKEMWLLVRGLADSLGTLFW